jgi:hypothetical protein
MRCLNFTASYRIQYKERILSLDFTTLFFHYKKQASPSIICLKEFLQTRMVAYF